MKFLLWLVTVSFLYGIPPTRRDFAVGPWTMRSPERQNFIIPGMAIVGGLGFQYSSQGICSNPNPSSKDSEIII